MNNGRSANEQRQIGKWTTAKQQMDNSKATNGQQPDQKRSTTIDVKAYVRNTG
jgi:hypothetical protein